MEHGDKPMEHSQFQQDLGSHDQVRAAVERALAEELTPVELDQCFPPDYIAHVRILEARLQQQRELLPPEWLPIRFPHEHPEQTPEAPEPTAE